MVERDISVYGISVVTTISHRLHISQLSSALCSTLYPSPSHADHAARSACISAREAQLSQTDRATLGSIALVTMATLSSTSRY